WCGPAALRAGRQRRDSQRRTCHSSGPAGGGRSVTGGLALNFATMRIALAVSAAALLSACSMGGITPAPSAQTERLQTAAVTAEEIAAQSPALPAIATECPPIKVRPGAEALYYYGNGQIGNPRDLQYQAVIDKQSRNCVVSNGL